jgi:hypothetical protein
MGNYIDLLGLVWLVPAVLLGVLAGCRARTLPGAFTGAAAATFFLCCLVFGLLSVFLASRLGPTHRVNLARMASALAICALPPALLAGAWAFVVVVRRRRREGLPSDLDAAARERCGPSVTPGDPGAIRPAHDSVRKENDVQGGGQRSRRRR